MSVITMPRPPDHLGAGRAEWLAQRHNYFNCSQVGALYDCHPHITIADVVAEKLAPAPPMDEPTEAMERGVRLEPVLLDWFADRHGVAVTTNPVMYANGRLLANLDGEIAGAPDEWVEAKTTAHTWDEPPPHVRWQVVAQSVASGRRRCHVVWIDATMRLKVAVIEPTDEERADVAARAEQFMAFIDLGLAPEGVVLSWEHLKALHPTADPEAVIELDDTGLDALVAWEQIRRVRLEAEKEEETAKAVVGALLGDAAVARYDGREVATWRNTKDRTVMDWKAAALTLAEIAGVSEAELVEAHTRAVPGYRTLRATRALLG